MTKILIVDDHEQNLYLLSFLLQSKGHEVLSAVNGLEALQKARAQRPAMIVTDILMPVMDGFTLCREWQSDPGLRRIPFVFYTATYTDKKDMELGLSMGAARFITKPLEPAALYTILESVIEEFENGRSPEPDIDLDDEPVFLKQYNERLVKKLEDKMFQLEQANQRLEGEVAARTAELTVALEKAQTADRLKSQFISDINHELRTPLNNLILYLSFLERGTGARQNDYISVLQRETQRLQWLISQLLDFSHLESGKLAANLEAVDLNRLAGELVQDRLELAQDKKLLLTFEPMPGLAPALADPKLLFQVLTNLLSNAINYTLPGGRIEVKTAAIEKDGRAWLTLSFQDTGLGISVDDQGHLFERFFRGESAAMTKASGAGLGLAICREIVDRHGGNITLESRLGEGSLFTVWLCPAETDVFAQG